MPRPLEDDVTAICQSIVLNNTILSNSQFLALFWLDYKLIIYIRAHPYHSSDLEPFGTPEVSVAALIRPVSRAPRTAHLLHLFGLITQQDQVSRSPVLVKENAVDKHAVAHSSISAHDYVG